MSQITHDIFTTACEGGINYWASIEDYRWSIDGSGDIDRPDLDAFEAMLIERDGDANSYLLNDLVITQGLRKAFLALEDGKSFGDYHDKAIVPMYLANLQPSMAFLYDMVDFDANTADIIVQYGLFGEMVYG